MKDSRCLCCDAPVEILSRSELSIAGQRDSIASWYRRILAFDLPRPEEGVLMKSSRVRLSREATGGVYKGFSGVISSQYTRVSADSGELALKENELTFSGEKTSIPIPFEEITSLTIESNTIIVVSREHGALFFDFDQESGKKWEDLIRKALAGYHSPERIIEFYPRLRLAGAVREKPGRAPGHKTLHVPVRRWYRCDHSPVFALARSIARPIIKAAFSVDISGIENLPEHGGAVLLSNHTSFLDSIILGVFTRRNIWFMAKNSEYRNRLLTWALKRARAFPVRRYTTDVQALRNAIRIVQQGHVLGIFPEGERTWDNTLLPFKYGTMRLVLALGKPVVPVGISGAYELMPRWTSTIERSPVRIRIGEPLFFDHIPIPRQTRGDIEHASEKLREQIVRLAGGQQ